ncbi:hypothetical protein CJF30_00006143 [Rutstroemia sp. NJR-2017a BBW]|nr:hypothetical protein CJF30_00006143 [Rutstroemia sp. NJR-2017a BBW]
MEDNVPSSPEGYPGWPETEPDWPVPIGENWEYNGIIQENDFAHITYWSYNPPPPVPRRPPHRSSRPGGYPPEYRGPRNEGEFLELLALVNSPHIIYQYGPPHTDTQGHEVLFLEYVPTVRLINDREKRDLWLLLGDREPALAEVDVWEIFSQFVKMINVLDRGDEDVNVQRWDRGEIWHCDIHPGNILMGPRNSVDDRCPVLKLCDFGDALEIPRLSAPCEFFPIPSFSSSPFHPPTHTSSPIQEQLLPDSHDHPRHGTCSNIFSFAHLIYLLMYRSTAEKHLILPPHNTPELPPVINDRLLMDPGCESWGWKLWPVDGEKEGLDTHFGYSAELRDLVMECMMNEPMLRPRPQELQERVERGLARARQEMARNLPMHPVFARVQVKVEDFGGDPRWFDRGGVPELAVRQWVPPEESEDDDDNGDNGYDEGREEDAYIYHIPMRGGGGPGTVGRGIPLMEYFERIGRMWMGEDIYYRMLEAGLDPEAWTPKMVIPDPEDDEDTRSLPEVVVELDSVHEEEEEEANVPEEQGVVVIPEAVAIESDEAEVMDSEDSEGDILAGRR